MNLGPQWFSGHVAYTLSKYAMSIVVLGMAAEFKPEGIAFNALWSRLGRDGGHRVRRRRRRHPGSAQAPQARDMPAALNRPARDFAIYRNDPAVLDLRPGMFLRDEDEAPAGAL